jgi:hypothetical protein
MSLPINIATDFSDTLINRDKDQGDGTFNGVEFRTKYLSIADSEEWWKKQREVIALDFSGVDIIGPSWANEVFAFFTRFNLNEKDILKRFDLQKISNVKLALIKREIASGYKV